MDKELLLLLILAGGCLNTEKHLVVCAECADVCKQEMDELLPAAKH